VKQLRWAMRIAMILVLAGGALFLRPTWLPGGDTSNLIVSGHSMDGTYKTGDLVVVKRAAAYRVGEIVGFQVPADEAGAGMVVIHRLHGIAPDGRFVTKGDNNPEPDPWTIAASDIRGRAIVRIPSAGLVGSYLRGPIGIAGIFGGLASWVAFGLLEDGDKPVTASTRRGGRKRLRRAATSRPAS
jgi:signal peptidase